MAIINITRNIIDYTILGEKLKNFEALSDRKPYIIMSISTFNEFYKNERCVLENNLFRPELLKLRGRWYTQIMYNTEYSIYINNNLKYGEIELV